EHRHGRGPFGGSGGGGWKGDAAPDRTRSPPGAPATRGPWTSGYGAAGGTPSTSGGGAPCRSRVLPARRTARDTGRRSASARDRRSSGSRECPTYRFAPVLKRSPADRQRPYRSG